MSHNKISFVREYCQCRRIPYRIKGEALFIGGKQVMFSIYNLTYKELINVIDDACEYDSVTTFYINGK